MTFRDYYYQLEKEMVNPYRNDFDFDSTDAISCYDAWHNMRCMRPSEVFESLAYYEEDTYNQFKWSDEVPRDLILMIRNDFVVVVQELLDYN